MKGFISIRTELFDCGKRVSVDSVIYPTAEEALRAQLREAQKFAKVNFWGIIDLSKIPEDAIKKTTPWKD